MRSFNRRLIPFISTLLLGALILIEVFTTPQSVLAGPTEYPLLLGVYATSSLQVAVGEIQAIDSWVADPNKKTSIAGTFMDVEFPNPDWNVPAELNAAWNAGYTPFVNLVAGYETSPTRTAAYIASGGIDSAIRTWAQEFAAWSNGGEKQAFIALFQEMNLDNVAYGMDPEGYKAAFQHVQQLFYEEGVSPDAVSWVFAPNGWSAPGDPVFEAYYPGDDVVDLLGFSSYNWGTDPSCTPWPDWEGPEEAFGPYLDRLRIMAPTKAIFIAQTASGSVGGDKDQWLIDVYNYAANYPALRGLMYFNIEKECDWAFYLETGRKLESYKTAISIAGVGHQHPIPFAFDPHPAYTFEDVWRAHPFAGVPDHPDWPNVEALYSAGYTAGCSADPPLYCPDAAMLRSQSAVFIERGIHGSGMAIPPNPTVQTFTDVPLSHWAVGWIEALWDDGYTAGCWADPLQYCPFLRQCSTASVLHSTLWWDSSRMSHPVGGVRLGSRLPTTMG